MNKKPPFFLEIRIIPSEKDSKTAYDEIYIDEGLSQLPSFYQWFLSRLDIDKVGRLLDVSCGSGEVVQLAKEHGLEAHGIDISFQAAQRARKTTQYKGHICTGAGEALPYADKSFDYITNVGSLEHFLDPAQGVREMTRILRSGGRAFILVPNTFSLSTTIWHAFRTGETSVDQQPIQRYAARADWQRLLEQNGLQVYKTIKYERAWPRRKEDWKYYILRPKEFLRLLATPLIPLNLAFCFIFFCKKAA